MSCKVDAENLDIGLSNILFEFLDKDDLFRMLKYDSRDALNLPITQQDKLLLINQDDDENSRIKMVPYNKDVVFTKAQTQIRISLLSATPTSKALADIVIMVQIVTHSDLWLLHDRKQRPLRLYTQVMQALNDTNVPDLGRLEALNRDMRLTYFNDQFIGYTIQFGVMRG